MEDIVNQIREKKKDEDKEELEKLRYKLRTLNSLDLLPKGGSNCFKCEHFNECPCMEAIRAPADIIVLTYAKAATIQRTLERASKNKKPAIASTIELRLLECRNFLFDESHELEDSKQKSISDEIKKSLNNGKELERNNLRNAFFNSNEIMEQRVKSFKYSVKIESSYFAAGTKE